MSDKEEINPSAAAEASPEENGVHHESAGAEEEGKGQSPKANDGEDENKSSKEEETEANEAIAAAQATAARLMAEHAGEAETGGDGEAPKENEDNVEGEQGTLKRPREDVDDATEAEEGPERKRASNSMLGSGADQTGTLGNGEEPTTAPEGGDGVQNPAESDKVITETLEISGSALGKVIGRNGETIRNLQDTTGTRIIADQSGEGPTKKITITGYSAEAVARAKEKINALETEVAEQAANQRILECPPSLVGRIIGRGGETIRALQAASEAHVNVNQDFPPDQNRQVIIQGPDMAVERAVLMVNELMHGEPGSAQAVIQRVCAQHNIGKSDVVDAPKMIIGRVIGRGGETVKQIQKITGATIQIDQSGDPCKVSLAGQPAAVEKAKQFVIEIVNGGDPFAIAGMQGGPMGSGGPMGPGPGGPPGGYGGPPGGYAGGYGGYGGYPPAAAGGYGGGYATGGYPPAAGGYGGYSQPAAGGYGGYPAQAAYPTGGYSSDPYGGGYGGYPQAGGEEMMGGAAMGAAAGRGGVAPGGGGSSGQWVEYKDDQGRPYYHNPATGATQWERPPDF